MWYIIHNFFGLPDGSVWPNIVASAVVGIIVWVWGLRHLKKLHHAHEERIHNHITNALEQFKIKDES